MFSEDPSEFDMRSPSPTESVNASSMTLYNTCIGEVLEFLLHGHSSLFDLILELLYTVPRTEKMVPIPTE